jgi:hypothetical protein
MPGKVLLLIQQREHVDGCLGIPRADECQRKVARKNPPGNIEESLK